MENKFQELVNLGVNSNKFIKLLISTIKNHKEMELEYKNRFNKYVSQNSSKHVNEKLNYINYLEKNFFSILLLSIFKNLKIDKKSITEYGVILHSLRGIVTCTDNIIDHESKGAMFLNEISNHVLSNNMLSIIQQNILNLSIDNLNADKPKKEIMIVGYSKALYSIALGENQRELNDEIESPREIIENIHKKIGGELLELAFIIPTINEENQKLNLSKEGIFEIGIALQMLDDICDFKEDIDAKKKNYLLSKIIYNSSLTLSEVISKSNEKEFYNTKEYSHSYIESIEESIEVALNGFKILEKASYPINQLQAKLILEFMFKVRGLKEAWELYEKKGSIIK